MKSQQKEMINFHKFLFNNTLKVATFCLTCLSTVSPATATSGFYRASEKPTDFHEIIDEFQQFANTEKSALNPDYIGARTLDPTQLRLTFAQEINIYFINEGAGFRNQLGVTVTGDNNFEKLIYKDISCIQEACLYPGQLSSQNVFGTPDGLPLEIGDYYNLGIIDSGNQLDFFLRRNGYSQRITDVWRTDISQNSDQLQHLITYEYQNYLVLAWEDSFGGGDLDYNDVIFVVDFGAENLSNLPIIESVENEINTQMDDSEIVNVPEPSNVTALLIIGLSSMSLLIKPSF